MKYNLTGTILDYEGKEVKEADRIKPESEWEGLTWRKIIFRSLNSILKTEPPLIAKVKERIYKITSRAYKGDELKLSVDDLAFLLDRISKIEGPLIYGRAKEFFEGQEVEKFKEKVEKEEKTDVEIANEGGGK